MLNAGRRDGPWLYLWILLVFSLAFWLRAAYFQKTIVDDPLVGDALYYAQYATNLVKHHTFSKDWEEPPVPDSYWAPGYPAFMAAILYLEKLTGVDSYKAMIYSQAVLGAATCVLALLLARLFLPLGWAVFAAVMTAISPHLVSLGNYLLTETLFCILLLSSLYFFLLGLRENSRWLYLASGICCGLGYLVNPVSLVSAIALVAAGCFILRKRRPGDGSVDFRLPLICLLPLVLTVAGWAARNAVSVPEGAQSASTRLYTNLIIGSHPDYHAIWREDRSNPDNPATVDMKRFDGSYSAFAGELSGRIAARPGYYLRWYLLEKPLLLWDWDIITGQGDIYVYPVFISLYHINKPAILTYVVASALHYWLLACMVLGLALLVWRYRDSDAEAEAMTLVYLTLVSISAVYILTQSEARYSIPLRPEMYLAATYFLYRLTALLRRRAAQSQAESAPAGIA